MTDRIIPVTVWLSPETHRAFAQRGATTRSNVSQVLSRLAEKAIEVKVTTGSRKQWTRVTPDHIAQARELARAGRSQLQIAHEIGISQSAVCNHWHRIIEGTSR